MLKRLILGTVIALILMLVLTTRPALAHPSVVQTDPPDGATLNEAPGEVRLFLTQKVLVDFTTIELVDGEGQRLGPLVVLAESALPPGSGEEAAALLIKLPALPSNTYRLAWKTRSGDDFHITSGAIVFGVQRPVKELAGPAGPVLPSWPEVVLRWLSFMAVAGITGILCLALLVVPRPGPGAKAAAPDLTTPAPDSETNEGEGVAALQIRLFRLARWSGWAALLTGASFLVWQGLTDNFSGERWWELLTATAFGQRWVVGEILLLLLLSLLYLVLRQLNTRRYKLLVIILLAGLTGAAAQNTHAGLPGSLPWLNFLADSLHLLGASAWIGGLAGLVLGLGKPLLLRQPLATGLAWLILRRFSLMAAASVPVLAITGFYKSGQQIASLDGLLTTLYGQALLFKFQLALFAALLGLFNALMLHPKLMALLRLPAQGRFFKPRLLRRTLLVELVALVVVVLLAAFLSAAEPARGPEFQPALTQTPAPTNFSTSLDDLVVNFSVKPNRPGRNFLDLYLYNTRRPAPAPFEKISLLLRSPAGQETSLDLSALRVQNDHYQLSGDQIQTGGDWQIELNVDRANLPVARANFDWKVGLAFVPAGRRPVVFSNQPIAPWFNLASGLVLLITVALWSGWYWLRKRHSTRSLGIFFLFGSPGKD